MNAGEHSSNYKSSTFLDPAGRRPGRSRKIIWAAWIAALSLIGLGISPGDETALRQFSEAVRRWQIDPEFRKAAGEYCSLGSAATRTRFIFIPTGRVVMAAHLFRFFRGGSPLIRPRRVTMTTLTGARSHLPAPVQ